eukprot:TRINITY_DN2285_c3_g1_i1.p1 TRINITY_DN2285_c3_g1~~TRINITY_DN2285_c3_g1_i1.p1  ORF type:complete len:272 (+),score=46.81 TRINITY_DN2285_c3_g1_i1:1-816(+)
MEQPLNGITVLEFKGLAPGPLCGQILCDFGARVIEIEAPKLGAFNVGASLNRGKLSCCINLKHSKGVKLFLDLVDHADVVIDVFRPGVLERLGLAPAILLERNPRLIIARLTGFGQTGTYAQMAGHDINYLAVSGILSRLGRASEKPTPPINIIGDFAAGSLQCAFGIMLALYERHSSGRGQVIDSAMVDGSLYLSSFIYKNKNTLFGAPRGKNLLDSGAPFYDTYMTKDGGYMAVGAIEPQFFNEFISKLGISDQIGVCFFSQVSIILIV